jgi:hypothetical protein
VQTIDTKKQYYSDRIRHFILFQDKHHPVTMGRVEAEAFWLDKAQAKKQGGSSALYSCSACFCSNSPA